MEAEERPGRFTDRGSRITSFWLALTALLLALLPPLAAPATAGGSLPGAGQEIAASQLPAEARETLARIRHGGPFLHDRDGIEFRNFERLLPEKPRGYYREYTVRTPGVKHRGARRIVAGRGGELYYTDDHYRSFRRIREGP